MKDSDTHPLRVARLNLSRPLTQQQLADFAGVSLSTIVRAEHGEPIRLDCIQRIRDYFNKPAQELGLRSIEIKKETNNGKASYTYQEVDLAQENENDRDMNRRDAVKLIGLTVGSALIKPPIEVLNADILARLSRILERPSSIDITALSSLEALTEHNWRLLYSGLPWRNLLSGVLGHLHSITQFLEGSQPTHIEQRLYALASQEAQMAGEIYFDMHDYSEAQSYYRLAIESAQKAHNPALTGVALARINVRQTDPKQLQDQLSLVEIAHRLATQNGTTTTKAWIAAREAELQANLGLSDACIKALEQAETVDHQQQREDDPYWTQFSPSSLSGYKGVCYVRLRQPAKAQKVLLEALETLPSRQATTLTDLAHSYALQGEIEEACRHAGQALTLSEQKRSVSVLQRIHNVRTDLEPWATSSYVKNLDEQIATTHISLLGLS